MQNTPGQTASPPKHAAAAIHDTLQTMYNVNLMGLMSGISNVAVNSVLGKQGMELVSSFFEGYQNGLYLTSILYLTVAVQVCALSVPVQAAYASTFMGMSAVNVAMSTVMFVASVMEHNDREILLYGTLLIVSLFEFSSAYNMRCEVTVQGGKGSNTLVYDGRLNGNKTKDIYRAVGVNEYEDIMSTGAFRGIEGKTLAAKEFGNNFNETLEFANHPINRDKVAIIKVKIPEYVYDQLKHMDLDVPIFRSGTTVVEPDLLEIFNNSIINIEHFY